MENTEFLKARIEALQAENERLKNEVDILSAKNEVLSEDLAYLFI